MANNLQEIKLLISRYWQGIVTAVTSLLAILKLYYDYSKGSSAIQLIVTLAAALIVIWLIRYPKIVFIITRLIVGQPKLPPDLRIFKGPQPYFEGDKLPGRRAELDACLQLLKQHPFFILQGESGSGKSSFLNASIKSGIKERFRIVECRIIDDPFSRLTSAFLQKKVVSNPTSREDELINAIAWAQSNFSNSNDKSDEKKPIVLIIDQFEELFVTVREDVRAHLMECLKKAIAKGEIRVVLAIRNDFSDLLLTLCRKIDPAQQVYNLGIFFDLPAFSEDKGRLVLDEMLEPLHEGDPLRKEQLNEFSENLVLELLRPPRDKRIFQGDEKSILPVELQITGMMIEILGIQNVIDKGITKVGGKTELLRLYIENAKEYVWRKTGVPGDNALLILRQLVSPARTKWAQTPETISGNIGMPVEQVASVLKAFADQYLVKQLPPIVKSDMVEEQNVNSIPYDLMHEHLVWVLIEAPQQILQKARDAEERLQFWNKRTESAFAISKALDHKSRKTKLKSSFVHPIPISETISLWRFATRPDDKRMLKRNLKGFLRQMAVLSLPLLIIISGFIFWTQTDKYLINKVIAKAPTDQYLVSNNRNENDLIVSWVKALANVDEYDNAFGLLEKITYDRNRSLAFAEFAVQCVSNDRIALADSALIKSLSIKGGYWTEIHQEATLKIFERMTKDGDEKILLNQITSLEDRNVKLYALIEYMKGMFRLGKYIEGDSVFNDILFDLKSIEDWDSKAEILFEIVDKAIENKRSESVDAGLQIMLKDSLYTYKILQSLSKSFVKNKDFGHALVLLKLALSGDVDLWMGESISKDIIDIVPELRKTGKTNELFDLVFEMYKRNSSYSFIEYKTLSFVTGLLVANDWDEGKDEKIRTLNPYFSFAAYSGAIEYLIDNNRFADATGMINKVLKKPIPYFLENGAFSVGKLGYINSVYIFLYSLVRVKYYDSALAVALRNDCDGAVIRLTSYNGFSFSNSPLAYVIIKMIKNKQYADVDKWLIKIKNPLERNYVLSLVAIEQMNSNHVEEANRITSEVMANADVAKITSGNDPYAPVGFEWLGYEFPIRNILKEFAEKGNSVLLFKFCDKVKYNSGILFDIALVLARLNKVDSLDLIINKIEGASMRSSAYAGIVSIFADSNRIMHAMNYLDKITNLDDRSLALASIAKYEARNKNFQKAGQVAEPCLARDKIKVYAYILNQYALKRNQKNKDSLLNQKKINIAESN